MVQCDRCLRWAYFYETDFPCTDAADATPFVCNFCNAVETLEARLRASEKDMELLREVVQVMKEQLDVLHAKPASASDAPTEKLPPQEPHKVAAHSCSSQADMSALTTSQTPPEEVELEVHQPKVELGNIQSPQPPQDNLSSQTPLRLSCRVTRMQG